LNHSVFQYPYYYIILYIFVLKIFLFDKSGFDWIDIYFCPSFLSNSWGASEYIGAEVARHKMCVHSRLLHGCFHMVSHQSLLLLVSRYMYCLKFKFLGFFRGGGQFLKNETTFFWWYHKKVYVLRLCAQITHSHLPKKHFPKGRTIAPICSKNPKGGGAIAQFSQQYCCLISLWHLNTICLTK